ncbi:MAG: hypothetical protein ACXVEX_13855, partial [Actinomycetota bacterium]
MSPTAVPSQIPFERPVVAAGAAVMVLRAGLGVVDGVFVVDARGDGFAEGVGRGVVAATVGSTVAFAVDVLVGVGRGVSLSAIVTRASGPTTYPLPKQPAGLLRCRLSVSDFSWTWSSIV